MGGSGDDAEFGGPRTHRGRVPRPAESSRISDDAGGANRVTAQRGGGQTRVAPPAGDSCCDLPVDAKNRILIDDALEGTERRAAGDRGERKCPCRPVKGPTPDR